MVNNTAVPVGNWCGRTTKSARAQQLYLVLVIPLLSVLTIYITVSTIDGTLLPRTLVAENDYSFGAEPPNAIVGIYKEGDTNTTTTSTTSTIVTTAPIGDIANASSIINEDAFTTKNRNTNTTTTIISSLSFSDASRKSNTTTSTPSTSNRPPFPWQWIHPLKTGTSFANALYMLACPEDYYENNNNNNSWAEAELLEHSVRPGAGISGASNGCRHKWQNGEGFSFNQRSWKKPRPLRPNWWLGEHAYRDPSLDDNQLFITLREPVDRMISQVSYQETKSVLERISQSNQAMANYLLYHDEKEEKEKEDFDTPKLGRQMTALLFPYSRQGPLDAAGVATPRQLADAACRIVQNAAWVGFSDDYERSICVLHAKFDPFPTHVYEMVNVRPTKTRNNQLNATIVGDIIRQTKKKKTKGKKKKKRANPIIILDDIVYKCARERFQRELQELAPQCM